MPIATPIPEALRHGPFTREQALVAGLPGRALLGKRFRRLFPRVWVCVDHVMTNRDWIEAARLAMPDSARMTGITRLQALGLDAGPLRPFHFVVQGDLHIDIEHIVLHRTVVMPPHDEAGVTAEAAFIAFADQARVIDAIKIGDWLLHHELMTVPGLVELARRHRWRPGSGETVWISTHLDGRSRSLKESETRAILSFAGLPVPEVNKDVYDDSGEFLGCGDLVYLICKLLVEYEGRQHEDDYAQWNSDIDRYKRFRDDAWRYVQVTSEKLRMPRKVVAEVYGQLVRGGYDGPVPVFGPLWNGLFGPVSSAIPRAAVTWVQEPVAP